MFNRMTLPRGNNRLQAAILIAVLLVLFAIGFQFGGAIFQPASSPSAASGSVGAGVAVVNPPHPLRDFTLTSKSGDPISLSSLRGREVVLFFGYTHCPDECPTTMANFKQVKQMLGDQADQS